MYFYDTDASGNSDTIYDTITDACASGGAIAYTDVNIDVTVFINFMDIHFLVKTLCLIHVHSASWMP